MKIDSRKFRGIRLHLFFSLGTKMYMIYIVHGGKVHFFSINNGQNPNKRTKVHIQKSLED